MLEEREGRLNILQPVLGAVGGGLSIDCCPREGRREGEYNRHAPGA